jgi:hypothetical protein
VPIGRLVIQSAAWIGPPQSRPRINHSTTDLGIPNVPAALQNRTVFRV